MPLTPIALRAATTLDLRVRRTLGRHWVFVDAINVMNRRFEELGFSLADFRGNAVAYAYPGATRAARVGVTLGFGRDARDGTSPGETR